MIQTKAETDLMMDAAMAHLQTQKKRPIFLGVKGSVVYELPGTHGDVDVRAIYLDPTAQMLAIRKPRPVVEHVEGRLDFVGWEAEKFLGHLLAHNGNFVELLLTPAHLRRTLGSHGDALREIAPRFITKRLHAYYRGYAQAQYKRAQSQITTGKGAVYTYREMYAGIWALLTGEIVFPWAELRSKVEDGGFYRSAILDEFDMDRERLSEAILQRMRSEFAELTTLIDHAKMVSPLPDTYDGYETCNRLLLQWRSEGWR